MIVKVLRNIVAYVTVAIAIGYFVYIFFNDTQSTYDYMILSLLILIATTYTLEMLDDKRKWKEVNNQLHKEISGIADCYILKYDNTIEWVKKMKELTAVGSHTFDSAALDKATRSKAKPQYSSIWGFLNDCSGDKRITFRHILRVRKNNLNNLLNRIISGSAQNNSYFAYYELPNNFSFPTFGIIDGKFLATRSPYQQGESPCYLIIQSKEIVELFIRYFDDLWYGSKKIENVNTLRHLLDKFQYDNNEKKKLQDKIEKISKEGIIDDI